jgi:hypothetical protein
VFIAAPCPVISSYRRFYTSAVMQRTAISSQTEYSTTRMEEQYGQALEVEHPRLAGIFSDRYPPQVQCAPGATADKNPSALFSR